MNQIVEFFQASTLSILSSLSIILERNGTMLVKILGYILT